MSDPEMWEELQRLRGQVAELEKQIRADAFAHMSTLGQCIEDHHWKGNCPAEKFRHALEHVERVMGPAPLECCQGCSTEWLEVLRTARAALDGET